MNKYRIGTNIPFHLSITDSGVLLDWSAATVRQVVMYSDDREAFAGACTHTVDEGDATLLDCIYPASAQLFTGALRVVIIFDTSDGRTLTYDLADVFALVAKSEEADSDGDTVTDATVTVSTLPISTVALILNACITATEGATGATTAANEAAEAADQAAKDAAAAAKDAQDITDIATTAEQARAAEFETMRDTMEAPVSEIALEKQDTYPGVIVASGKWSSGTNGHLYFQVPCSPGEKFRIYAQTGKAGYFAFFKGLASWSANGTPPYAEGYTGRGSIEANSYVDIVAPADAEYLYLVYTNAYNDQSPTFVGKYESILPTAYDLAVTKAYPGSRTVEYEFLVNQRIDLRPTSENYGKVVAATSADWGVTQFVDVAGYAYIAYYSRVMSSSPNYGGWTGAAFYDEDKRIIAGSEQVIRYGSLSSSGWARIPIPAGARYFRVCTYIMGDGRDIMKLYATAPTDLISHNDTYEHRYFGERISLSRHGYSILPWATNAHGGQSGAAYGKYLFIFTKLLDYVSLYDLQARELIYTWTTGWTAQSNWHSNQASFGVGKYDESDMFPVVYVSQRNNAEGRAEIQVFRILPTLTDGEVSSFTLALVQTIYLPVMTEANALGNPNVTIDQENGYMWTYSRNNDTTAANVYKAKFTKFAIPDLSQSVVTLDDDAILDSFGEDWSEVNAQGGVITGGRLYFCQGYANVGYIYLRVIDLYASRKLVSTIDMLADGYTFEPEAMFIYDGTLMVTNGGIRIYCFDFSE